MGKTRIDELLESVRVSLRSNEYGKSVRLPFPEFKLERLQQFVQLLGCCAKLAYREKPRRSKPASSGNPTLENSYVATNWFACIDGVDGADSPVFVSSGCHRPEFESDLQQR